MTIENIKFNSDGLVPAIVQDAVSKEVLTLAYMNEESIEALGEEVYEPSAVYGILYSQERLDEALALAAEQRKQGYRVVTQEIAGVDDVDVFTAQFEEVTFLIGKRGKGGQ